MEIQKTIKLNISKRGKNIIIKDLPTLQIVMGTKGVGGNLHYYGVKKEGTKYIVPVKVIQGRIEELEARVEHIGDCLDIMRQVVR